MNNSKEFHSSGNEELNSQTLSHQSASDGQQISHTKINQLSIDQELLQGNNLLKQTQMKHSVSLAEQSKISIGTSRLGVNNTLLAKSKQETYQTSNIQQSISNSHQSYSSPVLGVGNSQNSQNPSDQSFSNEESAFLQMKSVDSDSPNSSSKQIENILQVQQNKDKPKHGQIDDMKCSQSIQEKCFKNIVLNDSHRILYPNLDQKIPQPVLNEKQLEPYSFLQDRESTFQQVNKLTFQQEQESINNINLLLQATQLCLDTLQAQSDLDSKNQISHDDVQTDEEIGQNKSIQIINPISFPSTKKRPQSTSDQLKIKLNKAIEELRRIFKSSEQFQDFLDKLINVIEPLSSAKQLLAQFDQKKIMQLVFTAFVNVKQEQMLKSDFQLLKEKFVRFLDLFSQIKQWKPCLKNERYAFSKIVAKEQIKKYIEERQLLPSFQQWLKSTYSKLKESLEAKHKRKLNQKQQKDLENYLTYLYENNLNDPDNKSSTYISQIQKQANYIKRFVKNQQIQRCIQNLELKPERLKLLETITEQDEKPIKFMVKSPAQVDNQPIAQKPSILEKTEESFEQKKEVLKREKQRKQKQKKQKQKQEKQRQNIYSIYKLINKKDAVYSLLDAFYDQSNIFPDQYFTLNLSSFRFNYRGFQKAFRQLKSQSFDGLIEVNLTKLEKNNHQTISIVNQNAHKLKDLRILKLKLDRKEIIEEVVTMIRRIEPENKSEEFYDQRQQEQKWVSNLKIIHITLILKKQLVQPVSQLVKEITQVIERRDLQKVKPIQFIVESQQFNNIIKLNLNQINLRFLFHKSLQLRKFDRFDFRSCNLHQQKWEQFCQFFINFHNNIYEVDFSANQIKSIIVAHLESIRSQFPIKRSTTLYLKNNPLASRSYLSIAEFQMRNIPSKMRIFTSLTPEVHTMYKLVAALKIQSPEKVIYGLEWEIIRFLRSMIKNKVSQFNGSQTSPQIKKTIIINFLQQLKLLIPVSDNDKLIELKGSRSWFFENYGISDLGQENQLIQKVQTILDCIRLYVQFWLELKLDHQAQFQEIVRKLKKFKDNSCKNKRYDRKQLIRRKQSITKTLNPISEGLFSKFDERQSVKYCSMYKKDGSKQLGKQKPSIAKAIIQIYQRSFSRFERQQTIKYLSDFMLLQSFFSSFEQNQNGQDSDQYEYQYETEQKICLVLLFIRFDQSFAGLFNLQESEDNRKFLTQIYLSEEIDPKLRDFFYLQLEQPLHQFIGHRMEQFQEMLQDQNTKELHIQKKRHLINQLIASYLSRLQKRYAQRVNVLDKLVEGTSEKQLVKLLNKEDKKGISQKLKSKEQKKNWLIMTFYRPIDQITYSYLDDDNETQYKSEKLDQKQIDAERNFEIEVTNWSFCDDRSIIQRKKIVLNFLLKIVKADFQGLIGLVRLDLYGCEVNDRQFSVIVANLHKLKDLKFISGGNNITTVTQNHIQKLLQLKKQNKCQLKQIDLSSNKELTQKSKFLIDKFNENNQFMTHNIDCSKQSDRTENSEQKSKDQNQNNESTDGKILQKASRNKDIFIDNRDCEGSQMSQNFQSSQSSQTSSQIYDPNDYSDLYEDSQSHDQDSNEDL